jgi:hypothetical protein
MQLPPPSVRYDRKSSTKYKNLSHFDILMDLITKIYIYLLAAELFSYINVGNHDPRYLWGRDI